MIWKKIADFVLFSSLFIAVCALALVWQTYLLLNEEVSWRLAGMLFFGTVCLYNLESVFPNPARLPTELTRKKAWLLRHRKAMRVLALGAGALGSTLYLVGERELPFWFLLHLLLLSVLYSFPVFGRPRALLPLRNIPLLKVFLIAYVWAALSVLLPLLYAGRDLWAAEHLVLFARRFLFIFALALLFDIRDYSRDRARGLITFPVLMGIGATKVLGLGLLGLFGLLCPLYTSLNQMVALLLSGGCAAGVILAAREDRSEHYFLGWADGMMLLQFLLVLLFMQL